MTHVVQVDLKVFYNLDDIKCVAKGDKIDITLLEPGSLVGRVDLRPCLLAATTRSPELVNDKRCDYSVYALDATEDSGDFYEGQGLLSWNMVTAHIPTQVTGRLRTTPGGGQALDVRLQLKRASATSQAEFFHNMATFDAVSRMLPATFEHSSWSDLMRLAGPLLQHPQVQQGAQQLRNDPSGYATQPRAMRAADTPPASLPAAAVDLTRKVPTPPVTTTLHKAREQKAREQARGSVAMFNMSAQLHHASQSSVTQKSQAQRIAQQAMAAKRQQQHTQQQQQRRAMSRAASESEGVVSDFPSPSLPTPSSPPQMRTFAPPPASTTHLAAVAGPLARSASTGGINTTTYALPDLQRSTSSMSQSQSSGQKRKASPAPAPRSESPAVVMDERRTKRNCTGTFPASSMAAALTTAAAAIVTTDGKSNDAATVPSKTAGRAGIVERQTEELFQALNAGQVPKYCSNCGTIETRGSWRSIMVDDQLKTFCNPCGVYYKTKRQFRPEKLWQQQSARARRQDEQKRLAAFKDKNKTKDRAASTPGDDKEGDTMEPVQFTRTSPVRPDSAAGSTRESRYRATQSSPARRPPLSSAPTPPLAELPVNTPPHQQQQQPQQPSSPRQLSSSQPRDELAALLRTPCRPVSAGRSQVSLSGASPWRSMFTTFTEDSPSRQKFDKFLEDFAKQDSLTHSPGTAALAAAATALMAASPSANGFADFANMSLFGSPAGAASLYAQDVDAASPTRSSGLQADLMTMTAGFLSSSSPPSMGNFTSGPLMQDETLTPPAEHAAPMLSASKTQAQHGKKKLQQQQQAQADEGSSVETGLFTPKRTTRHAKTPSSITRRALRSAGMLTGEMDCL